MKHLTFVVNTQRDPPAPGNHIQVINAHSASFAHKKRRRRRPNSVLPIRPKIPNTLSSTADVVGYGDDSSKAVCLVARCESSQSTSSTREQQDYSLELCPHAYSFDAQLISVLDPFSRTPLQLSRHEQVTLQQFLTNDKMLVHGTAFGPQQICFTRAYSRANSPWASKLHLLAQVIMAEESLGKRNKSSSTFYLRRAQIYEAMNQYLVDQQFTFREKLIAFQTLGLIETSLRMLNLQETHVIALHHFIENNGGLSRAFSELCPADLEDDLPGSLVHYLSENVPICSVSELEQTLGLFLQILRDTVEWASGLTAQNNTVTLTTAEPQRNGYSLPRLRGYLASLVCYLKRENLSSRAAQGIYHGLFGILLLYQVVYNYNASTSLRFLEGLEACLETNSTSTTYDALFPNIFWAKGVATSSVFLNSVHSKIGAPVKGKEIRILEGIYASLRLVALLSPTIRIHLSQIIHRCVLATTHPVGTDILKESFLQAIAGDVRKKWNSRRTI